MELGRCSMREEPTITPDLPEREVAERLASYNMLALGVCDDAGRLLERSPVDDVPTARCPPVGWQQQAVTLGRCRNEAPRDLTTPRQRQATGLCTTTRCFRSVQRERCTVHRTAVPRLPSGSDVAWVIGNTLVRLTCASTVAVHRPHPAAVLKAAYAAPLILLAPNRRGARPGSDRSRPPRRRAHPADTEFLARELAGVRLGLADVASSSELEGASSGSLAPSNAWQTTRSARTTR